MFVDVLLLALGLWLIYRLRDGVISISFSPVIRVVVEHEQEEHEEDRLKDDIQKIPPMPLELQAFIYAESDPWARAEGAERAKVLYRQFGNWDDALKQLQIEAHLNV